MNRLSQAFAAVVALLFAAGAPAQLPDPLVETLHPERLPPAWESLLSGLRSVETLRADFEERRFFGFRAKPVVLRGQLRLDRNRGLSLHYTDPETYTVIVDDSGVLVRDPTGRERAAPANATRASAQLLEALELDLQKLAADFLIRGRLDPPAWSLALEAHERGGAIIELGGSDHLVRQLTLIPSPRRRIEIALRNIVSGDAFGPEELQRYFR